MSQWAEVRHLHLVEKVPKKEIARRLQLDVKTVRRAVEQPTPPVRVSPPRTRGLDPWREQIAQWLRQDRRLTAKRIRRLLLPLAGPVAARPVRRYVAALRVAMAPKEAFVHRSVRAGTTMEVDFGESWADIAGVPGKVKYLVATLPASNVYFAKAYPLERLESLLDGIESAFTYFGGVVERVVLDNTSLAVKQVLAGRDRAETEAFAAFRGAYPFRAEYCAPAKGWEKGSVETGVKYVRNLVFRPRPKVESWAALNALIITELEADLPMRHLDDGRSAEEAWRLERQHLRALPVHRPATCRVVARVADKFGHVRVDHVDVFGADPPRLPAGGGEAVSRPGGGCRRRGGGRAARPGVLQRLEGPRGAARAGVAGTQAPGRARGDGPSRLAAGAGVAAGASGAGKAHAQARSGMGPDVAVDGDASGRGRRARGDTRARAPFAAPGDGAAPPPAAAGRPAADVSAGHGGASGPGADRGARPTAGSV